MEKNWYTPNPGSNKNQFTLYLRLLFFFKNWFNKVYNEFLNFETITYIEIFKKNSILLKLSFHKKKKIKDANKLKRQLFLKMTLALFLMSITKVSAYHHHNSIERPLIQV